MWKTSVAILFAALGAAAAAQPPTQSVRWSATGPADPVRPGGTATVAVVADVQSSWHLYSMTQPKGGPIGLEIKAAKGQPFEVQAGKISAPAPKTAADENFQLPTRYYDRKTTFTVPVTLSPSAPEGPQMLSLEVRFQACSGSICLRPATQTLQVPVTVSAKP